MHTHTYTTLLHFSDCPHLSLIILPKHSAGKAQAGIVPPCPPFCNSMVTVVTFTKHFLHARHIPHLTSHHGTVGNSTSPLQAPILHMLSWAVITVCMAHSSKGSKHSGKTLGTSVCFECVLKTVKASRSSLCGHTKLTGHFQSPFRFPEELKVLLIP